MVQPLPSGPLLSGPVLVVDTSLAACSAAVFDGATQRVLASRFEAMARGHAEALAPMVDAVLKDSSVPTAAIGAVGTTRGPGTFTGLRIGLSFAKAFGLARGIPVLAIDTLTASAAPFVGTCDCILVVQDAGATGLVHAALLDGRSGAFLRAPALLPLAEAVAGLEGRPLTLLGSGAAAAQALLPGAVLAPGHGLPEAAGFAPLLLALHSAGQSQSATPLYLREPDARPSATAPAPLLVRRATEADIAALASLHSSCFEQGWSAKDLAATLALPGTGAFVVVDGGAITGFVQAQQVADEAEIHTLCVAQGFRHLGHGSLLLRALMDALSASGVRRLFLEVAAGNQPALGLYGKHGFRQTGVRKAYYTRAGGGREDAITMALALPAGPA